MHIRPPILAAILTAYSQIAFAGTVTITIEDDGLRQLPRNIETAVKAAKLFDGELKECKLVGKALPASRGDGRRIYFATTEPACWGAAVGPMILVQSDSADAKVVFAEHGYLVRVTDPGSRKSSLSAYAGTAGWEHETEWQIKDGKYVKVSERRKTLGR